MLYANELMETKNVRVLICASAVSSNVKQQVKNS